MSWGVRRKESSRFEVVPEPPILKAGSEEFEEHEASIGP